MEKKCLTQNSLRIFVCGATAQLGPRPPKVYRPKTIRHKHRLGRLLRTSDQLVAEAVPIQQTIHKTTNIQALSGVQTRHASNQAAAGLHLDHMATGIGQTDYTVLLNFNLPD